MFNFEKAIKFPYQNSDWTKTVGVHFIIVTVFALFSFLLQIALQLPADILSSAALESEMESLRVIASSINLTYLALSTMLSLLALPVTIYLSGYIFDVVRHIVYAKDPSITAHGNYALRLKLGLARGIINIGLSLITSLLLIIPVIPSIAAMMTIESNRAVGLGLYFFAVIMFILWLVIATVGRKFAIYSAEHIYLTEGFSKIFNIKKVFNMIGRNWKLFLNLFIVEVLVQILLTFAFLLFCMAFFVFPIISASVQFSMAYLYGEVFKKIS